MKLREIRALIFVMIIVSILSAGCQKQPAEEVDSSIQNSEISSVESLSDETKMASISVENVSSSENEKIIAVKITNNQGFLTMALNIAYDSEVMSLTSVQNGDIFSEYSFVPPKNKKSGCTASWYITDLPDTISDGELMFLHFTVDETCPAGSYPVTVSCPDDGSIVDGNMNPFSFPEAMGFIIIE